jgi:hypothetical protein
MPVSLYGQVADMAAINGVAARHGLAVIEDAAQSFGAGYRGQGLARKSCNLSTIACTSFFPSKPLGCYGDGGALFTSDPAIAQAALAHAQFETIHPFVDGNGRTGRALIHVILRRRGLAARVLPPISLILATRAEDYIAGLTATRHRGRVDSAAARDGLNRWVGSFAAAANRSVTDAAAFEARVVEIQTSWRLRVGRIRQHSGIDRLIQTLPGAPLLTVSHGSELIGRSFQQTNEAISRLVDAGILTQVSIGRRNRAFEASEIVDGFMDLERQLASPTGDTRSAPPVRNIPRRRPAQR